MWECQWAAMQAAPINTAHGVADLNEGRVVNEELKLFQAYGKGMSSALHCC